MVDKGPEFNPHLGQGPSLFLAVFILFLCLAGFLPGAFISPETQKHVQ